MAETTTVARPYARAAFDHARSTKGGLKKWSDALKAASAVAVDTRVQALLKSPSLDGRAKAAVVSDLVAQTSSGKTGDDFANFLGLLAENGRLILLPEIESLFESFRAAAEKTLQAEMISAFEVSEEQRLKIAAALKGLVQREVELSWSVDSSLMGGVIIRAGDLVIDGSARGHLEQLAGALRQ